MDDIQALREDYSRQLEEIRIADAEEYTALKIRLENEIQACGPEKEITSRGEMESEQSDSYFYFIFIVFGRKMKWCAHHIRLVSRI